MHAKVLLVDDEAPFIETLAKRLSKRELTILTAFSGAEALQKLDSESGIDVVVLDVKMPGMDGIETLKAIKNIHPLVGGHHAHGARDGRIRDRGDEAGRPGLPHEAV